MFNFTTGTLKVPFVDRFLIRHLWITDHLLTCYVTRSVQSSPCRRVTETSRHHCGEPVSLLLSSFFAVVAFHQTFSTFAPLRLSAYHCFSSLLSSVASSLNLHGSLECLLVCCLFGRVWQLIIIYKAPLLSLQKNIFSCLFVYVALTSVVYTVESCIFFFWFYRP